jgi:hypothetical protein
MTFQRLATTAVLAGHADLVTGTVLELGVGDHPYARDRSLDEADSTPRPSR